MTNPNHRRSNSAHANNRLSRMIGGLFSSKSGKKKSLQQRTTRFEPLEVRQLLSVSVNPSGDVGDDMTSAYVQTLVQDTQYDINSTISDGSYGMADVDLYEVSLTSGDHLTADIDAEVNSSQLDSYLRIFDSSGTELAYNDDYDGYDSKIEFDVPSTGTYYVGVSSYENDNYDPDTEDSGYAGEDGYGGDYTLKLTSTTPGANDPTATISLYNDTDTPGDLITTDPTVTGSVTFDDEGYGNGYVEIEFDNDGDGSYESYQTLYNTGDSFTYDPTSYTPSLPYGSPTSLNYRLKEFDDSYSLVYTGAWTSFDFTYQAAQLGDTPGDDLTNAQLLTLTDGIKQEITATIGDGLYGTSDVDLYKVTLNTGDTLLIDIDANQLDDYSAYSSLNSHLRLFDGLGNQLEFNSDGTDPDTGYGGIDSFISYTASPTGTYYIGVSGYGNESYDPTIEDSSYGGSTGDYYLQVTRCQYIANADSRRDSIGRRRSSDYTGRLICRCRRGYVDRNSRLRRWFRRTADHIKP